MATVTGSGTVNWSTIPFAPVNFQADIVEFNALLTSALTEFGDDQFTVLEASSTLIRVLLNSGGTLVLSGEGFGAPGAVITQIEYSHTDGQTLRMSGEMDGVGTDPVSSISITKPGGISELISGGFSTDNGVFLGGPVTELSVTHGSYVSRISGDLTVDGAGNISGTIQALKVQGPDGTIEMTGLALPFHPTLASVTTADELLSVIGGLMEGDEDVSYANNSTTGMTFLGGTGNDSIMVSGPNDDTLVGGDGNDTLVGGDGNNTLVGGEGNNTLVGGMGVDSVLGGSGSDQVEMLVTAGAVDAANGGGGFHDVLILRGVVGGDGTIVVNMGLLDQVVSIGGDPSRDTLVQTGFENVVMELEGRVDVTGAAGGDVLFGLDADDTLAGAAGDDTLIGSKGMDSIVGGTGDDWIEMQATAGDVDAADGGAGTHDRLILRGVVGGDNTIVINLGLLDQVISIAGDPARDTLVQTGFEAVNASELGGKVNATGTAGADIFLTGDGADTLTGGSGDDTLIGGVGMDMLMGGTGDDRLEMLVTAGDVDLANGGAGGNDVLVLSGVVGGGDETVVADLRLVDQVVSIAGDPSRDTLVQTGFEDIDGSRLGSKLNATGTAGTNLLIGSGGEDSLTGEAGNDTLAGNGGADTLAGGTGADHLLGGAGDDIVVVASTADYAGDNINGGNGTDVLRFAGVVAGTTLALNASMAGLEEVRIATASGDAGGSLSLNVNAAVASTGLSIYGNDGANVITGTAFQDNLSGQGGNDVFLIGAGGHHAVDESIDGGAGEGNVIRFTRTAADTLTLSAFVTNIREVEASNAAGVNTGLAALNIDASAAPNALVITGNAGSNALTGTAGNDTITGNAGNDRLAGGAGDDALNGGAGADTADYSGAAGGVAASLAEGTAQDGLGGVDSLNLIENLTGSAHDDTLTGSVGANVIDGGEGVDRLSGDAGNDVFIISAGAHHAAGETIDGGGGVSVDTIRFTATSADLLVLSANTTGIEQVMLGAAVTSTAALDIDASNVANRLTITGNNGANVITGTGQNDTINGNGGDDSLGGGLGDDSLLGGAGDDTLNGGTGADRLFGGAGNDTYEDVVPGVGETFVSEALNMGTDTVRTQVTYTLGAHLENLVLLGGEDISGFGNTLNNVITGNGGANLLDGGAGNDTLVGGSGQDTLNGGAGNDRLVVSVTTGEVVVADGAAGSDTLVLVGDSIPNDHSVFVDLLQVEDQLLSIGEMGDDLAQNNFEHVDASGLNAGSFLNAQGSGLANLLIGSNNGDVLGGGGNNDTLVGGAGSDSMQGGDGNDLFLIGDGEHESSETADGGAGFDIIRFTSTIEGGLTLSSNVQSIEQVVIGSAAGAIIGTTALDVDASAVGGVPGLTIVGNNGVNAIVGTHQNDTINGNAGNDTLEGGGGTDRLAGGTGNDVYVITAGDTDAVIEALNAGIDLVNLDGRDDYTLELNVENAAMFNVTSGTLRGNALANSLLFSGTGDGSLTGGTGNDTLTSDSPGQDTLNGGAGNDTLAGGAGQDSVLGGDGNDRIIMLVTAGGVDVANGGVGGIDTLALAGDAGGTVTVNLAAAAAGDQVSIAGETLLQNNFENLDASGLLNPVIVTGNSGANVITGTPGLLIDNLAGGGGNDTYRIFSNDNVTENSGQGTDSVILLEMLGGYVLPDNVEHLTILGWESGSASGNGLNNTILDDSGESLALSGGGGADRLLGGAGNDTLGGDSGTDTLLGGAGDDIYRLNLTGPNGDHADRIIEGLNQGTDTVVMRFIGNYTLPANIENGIMGGAGPATLRGNALDNVLQGFAEGAGGFLLDGGAGNDSLAGSLNGDALLGGLGNDTLAGSNGSDTLLAGAGDDVIRLGAISEFGATEFMDGGPGTDMLQLTGAGQTLQVTSAHNRIVGIEIVDLTGSGDNALVLSLGDLLALSTTTDILRVDGNSGDTVASAGQGWVLTEGGPITIGAHQYNAYTSSLGTLLVDTDVTQTNIS